MGDTISDKYLVQKILAGDTNSFKIVIKNTEKLVAQIVFKMINNFEDRKDIAQDVYLKSYQNLEHFKYQSKLSTWIAKITYNTCLNYLDRKKLVLLDNFDHDDNDRLTALSDKLMILEDTEIETKMFQNSRKESIAIAIELLPPLYKTLIVLYHNEELSYKEIAQITDIPEGTVKNYLYRARKNLKENLLSKYKKEDLC